MKSKQLVFGVSLLLTASFFSSCANNDDDKKSAVVDQARPRPLNFSVPAAGAELTKAQIYELKQVFSQKPSIDLPPSRLLLKDPVSKMSEDQIWELQREEYEMRYTASAETYALYMSLRNTCHKQSATLNFDATIPTEKITDITDLKTGDHLIASTSGAYGGAACDVDVSGNVNYSIKADRLDKDGLATGSASYSLKALMKNPKYAKLLRSRGIMATSSVSGVVAKQTLNSDDLTDGEANLKYNINGSYFTLNNEIPFTSSYTIYGKPVSEASGRLQTETIIEVKMPTFSAQLLTQIEAIVFKDGKQNRIISQDYYLNGHKKTVQEISEIFNDLNSEKSAEIIQTFLN